VWSLGVAMFELLTGSVPWSASEVSQIISQILYEPPRRLRELVPDAPAALEEIIEQCLEKDPAKRMPSAADLAVALGPFAPKHARSIIERIGEIARSSGGVAIHREDSLPPPAPLRPTGAEPVAVAQTLTSLPQAQPRSSVVIPVVIGAIAVLLLLAGGAGFLFFRAPAAPTVPVASTPMTVTTTVSSVPALATAPSATVAAAANAATAVTTPTPSSSATSAVTTRPVRPTLVAPVKTSRPAGSPTGVTAPADTDIVRAR
jgi:serine/threonine-protein kinase